MTKLAIQVEHLSKAYRIGRKVEVPDTLIAAVQGSVLSPLKNFRRLNRMNTFKNRDDSADTFWALRDVSFEVVEGEVVGIIGRNGAGKSTLLKILSRITEPTSGRAVIHGRVSSLLEVGTGFHQELTGRENVYMNGTILGMTKREINGKFDEIVAFSGVEKFLDTPIKHYSSGMKVRLAFSVAAHLEPEILIIDEVLAVGDAEFQNRCMGKMGEVARSGRTVLFVSHNLAAIESLCDRAMTLQNGRCLALGKSAAIVANYLSDCTAHAAINHRQAFDDAQHFREATLLDGNGNPTDVIPLGGPFHLRLRIDVRASLRNPQVGVGINTAFGQRVLTVLTPVSNNSVRVLEGISIIHCWIPRFPLAPGKYVLRIVLREALQELESFDSVVPFSVVNAELFDEGRGFTSGICIAECKWSSGDTPGDSAAICGVPTSDKPIMTM